jgi:hypothetical protein
VQVCSLGAWERDAEDSWWVWLEYVEPVPLCPRVDLCPRVLRSCSEVRVLVSACMLTFPDVC